ncbi:MAG: hypothetical protein AAGJ31_14780, partial [Verrucomicrobiota bacterium]
KPKSHVGDIPVQQPFPRLTFVKLQTDVVREKAEKFSLREEKERPGDIVRRGREKNRKEARRKVRRFNCGS